MTRYRMMNTLCLLGALHMAHARPQGIAEAGIPSASNAGAVEPIDYDGLSQPADSSSVSLPSLSAVAESSSPSPVAESSSLGPESFSPRPATSVVTTPSLAASSSVAASVPSVYPLFTKYDASPPASVSPSPPSLLPSIDSTSTSTSTGTLFLVTTVVTSISRPASPSGYYSDYLLSSYPPAPPAPPPVPTSSYVPVPVPAPATATYGAPPPPPPAHTDGVPVDPESGCRKHGYHGDGYYGNGTRTGAPGTGGAAAPGSGAGGAASGSGAGHDSGGGAGTGDQSGWDGEGNQHHDTAGPDEGDGKDEEESKQLVEAGAGTTRVRVLGVFVPGLLSVAFLV